ncbi:HNH endonuclease [Catenuloplanes indicus]|uniref:HNH nuclease domain-containing protein n=1 Tax=Catenuloplanes indicus TaxID=137267 RepID=A0AAE4AY31_9ACTN|nr:HNH endonuclease [Catenuloplanes indicus]MDQ0366361.1 hypothetical protein [Catenuloplanes indicus]
MNKELLNRFDHACAYCGDADASPVDEHVVPMNRASVGLHAWGNIVPACRPCNNAKKDDPWYGHPMLDEPRREAISAYITEYRYEPDVDELKIVMAKLYELADQQTRALVEFGLVASRPYIAGMHTSPPAELIAPTLATGEEAIDTPS